MAGVARTVGLIVPCTVKDGLECTAVFGEHEDDAVTREFVAQHERVVHDPGRVRDILRAPAERQARLDAAKQARTGPENVRWRNYVRRRAAR